ncbi:MAG: DUF4153 domain-containing protein [Coraliomargaritaceae bacterium]
MNILGLSGLFESIRSVFFRFPLPVVCTLTTCILSVAVIEHQGNSLADSLSRWIAISSLAFVATLMMDLLCLALQTTKRARIFTTLLALAGVLAATHLLVPPIIKDALPPFWYSFWITLFAFHLGIALSPLARNQDPQTFWNFNLRFFYRFFFSTMNAALLFIGLALALSSIDRLFGLNVNEELYLQIWLFAAFAVHPLIFLGGVPSLDEMSRSADFPKPLRFTLQFIGLPLVVLYLLILYTYIAKIGVDAQWPDGWVSLPIFVLSLIGTLTAILSLPLVKSDFWATLYHRWLYRLLLPLSIVLFLALQIRLDQYGMTINRYLALMLAIWLFVISMAFIIRPRLHIRWLPSSLLIVALFSVYSGPWSAFEWSQRSQVKQVRMISAEAGALKEGAFVPSTTPENLSADQRAQFVSSLRYILNHFGSDPLQAELSHFLKSPEYSDFEEHYSYRQTQNILQFLDLKSPQTERISRYRYSSDPMPTGGHLWMMPKGTLQSSHKTYPHSSDDVNASEDKTLALKFNHQKQTLAVTCDEILLSKLDTSIWVNDIIHAELKDDESQLAKPLYWDFEGQRWSFRFVLEEAGIQQRKDSPHQIQYLSGRLFYTPPN